MVSKGKLCSIHRAHTPRPKTVEAHHVVPQAWQQVFKPTSDTADLHIGHGDQGRMLWDSRTVLLCPTGHRNVHFHLVALMKDATHKARGPEHTIAKLAMSRFTAAGGSLEKLRELKLFGQA